MIELLEPHRGCRVTFVREIVRLACETVDEGDRTAQSRRQQARRDGKILVMLYRHERSAERPGDQWLAERS